MIDSYHRGRKKIELLTLKLEPVNNGNCKGRDCT
jgi:hypothetical protein